MPAQLTNRSSLQIQSPNGDGSSVSTDKPEVRTPFQVMRLALQNYWVQVGLQVLFFALFFIVGIAYYHHVEKWTLLECLNFSIVTISTVGYGYQHPTNDNSRVFTIFYIIVGIYFIFFAISNAIAAHFQAVAEYVRQRADAGELGKNLQQHRYMLACTVVSIVISILVGGGIFTTLEDWTFVQGVYFAIETSTTVGYGDLPINNGKATNWFIIFYVIFSTVLFASAFNTVNMIREEQRELALLEEITVKKKDLAFISELDQGQGVSEGQFILAVLEHLGTLNFDKDIKPWREKFRELDPKNTGKVFSQGLTDFSMRESIAADDQLSRMHRQHQESAISNLLRPSLVMRPSNLSDQHVGYTQNSPITHTISRDRTNSSSSHERRTVQQAALLSHYA